MQQLWFAIAVAELIVLAVLILHTTTGASFKKSGTPRETSRRDGSRFGVLSEIGLGIKDPGDQLMLVTLLKITEKNGKVVYAELKGLDPDLKVNDPIEYWLSPEIVARRYVMDRGPFSYGEICYRVLERYRISKNSESAINSEGCIA